jgi:eukaryotic-like serine/threonine-protein kinase
MSLEELQNGRYRLLRLIGKGAMGQVYLAEDTRIQRQVAIKVIQTEAQPYPGDETTREAVRLFHREAQTIARLNHPHILPLFDFDEASSDGSTPTYMVMPFCPEGSLAEWLRQRKDQGALAPQDVVQLVHQAADALQYAHEHGIIHRDVKPANLLIRSNRENPTCPDLLLADFGVAKLSAVATGSSQSIRGTPHYMSPEQWSGAPVPATDQYALAVMAYELVTGRAPFQGNSNQVMYQHVMVPPQPPSAVNPHLPAAVDAVLLRALAKDPAERFPSIADFARAFQQVLLPELSQSAYGAYGVSVPLAPASANQVPPTLAQPPRTSYTTVHIPDIARLPVTPTSPAPVPPLPVNQGVSTGGQPSGLLRGGAILLAGLALLVILAGVGGSLALLNHHGSGVTRAPTQSANHSNAGNATATSNARLTATAGATSPVASVTTSTLTQVPNPYPPHTGTLVLSDPLRDNSKGNMWDITSLAGEGSCGFMNNAYYVTQVSPLGGITGCNPEALPVLGDFTLQVQLTILSGDAGGVTLRVVHSNFYLFAIAPDGSYHFDILNGLSLPSVVKQGSSSAIHKGLNQPNLLAVVARGGTFMLYVNNQLIDTVSDATFATGQIGLAAEESSNTTAVAFSNAMVWKMP